MKQLDKCICNTRKKNMWQKAKRPRRMWLDDRKCWKSLDQCEEVKKEELKVVIGASYIRR